ENAGTRAGGSQQVVQSGELGVSFDQIHRASSIPPELPDQGYGLDRRRLGPRVDRPSAGAVQRAREDSNL
ncbi:MAG TPA: hypothetical protein VF526_16475, partial [Solirubrobacteraceae bacterium]